jgi:UDP-N-acetyl-D-mannosaminuronate dehydrogenase
VDEITDAEGYDLVILVTAHKACLEIDWKGLLTKMRTPLLYDGRRVLDLDKLESMGWKTHAVGKPV